MSDERGSGGREAREDVWLDASPERVWRALTDAEELERWFPLEARVEPGEGGEIYMSWGNEFAGSSRILAWEPPRRLATTWGERDDEAGGGQVTEYRLEAEDGGTRLRVVTSGFPDDPSWDDWIEGTRHGWRFELASLKEYLERHSGRDRKVLYLRRRTPLSRAEAWERLAGDPGVEAATRGAAAGEPVADAPPWQYAARLEEPRGALMRLTVDPCVAHQDHRDVTLFLSAWEEGGDRLGELGREWTQRLERLFPEGETV